MKGNIFDIKRFAVHDGPGIRSTVFFKGCPLNCSWCHNPESKVDGISKMKKCYKIGEKEKITFENVGRSYTAKELLIELLKDLHVMEESNGCVTISGGEPLSQIDFLKELLYELKTTGIHTCIDTSGYTIENRFEQIIPDTDLFLFDMKHYDENKHIENTGVSLNPIIQNLNILLERKEKVWLRIPIIPNVNNSHEDKYGFLYKIQNLIRKPNQIHLLPYHNIAGNKYTNLKYENKFKEIPSLSRETLKPFKEILERSGYNVKIGG